MKDYFDALGLDPTAEKRHIEAAFQQKVMNAFPGLETEDQAKTKKFLAAAEAYAVLHDDRSRKGYEYACSKSPTGHILDETSGKAGGAAETILAAIRQMLAQKQEARGLKSGEQKRQLEMDLWSYLFGTNFLPGPEPLHFSIPASAPEQEMPDKAATENTPAAPVSAANSQGGFTQASQYTPANTQTLLSHSTRIFRMISRKSRKWWRNSSKAAISSMASRMKERRTPLSNGLQRKGSTD